MKAGTYKSALAAAMMCVTAGQAYAAIIVHTTDFIVNSNRAHFNGFDAIPNDGVFYTGGGGPYSEDTIQVQQINGDGIFSIWVTFSFWAGFEGPYEWYPNAGDRGYTQLSLAGGIDFVDVGFRYGNSGTGNMILYELLDDGVVVLSGNAALGSGINYLGFSGGGFDTIRVRDNASAGTSVTDRTSQTLAIDSIETQGVIPEPASLALLGLGLAGLGWSRRRKQ